MAVEGVKMKIFSNFQKPACSLLQDLKVLLKHFFEIQPLNRPEFDYRMWLPGRPYYLPMPSLLSR